jgi:hypothetical protein
MGTKFDYLYDKISTNEDKTGLEFNAVNQRIVDLVNNDMNISNYVRRINTELNNNDTKLNANMYNNDINMSNYVTQLSNNLVHTSNDIIVHISKNDEKIQRHIDHLHTDNIREGNSNLYYTSARVSSIVDASNLHTSNYVRQIAGKLTHVVDTKFDHLYDKITETNVKSIAGFAKVDVETDRLHQEIMVYDNSMSNYVNVLYSNFEVLNTKLYATDQSIGYTSNAIIRYVDKNSDTTIKYVDRKSETITRYINNSSDLLSANFNRIATNINTRVDNLHSDNIKEGASNLYYTPARVAGIVTASNLHTSNYIRIIEGKLSNTITQKFDYLYDKIFEVGSHIGINDASLYGLRSSVHLNDTNVSNYVKHIENSIYNVSNLIDAKISVVNDSISDLASNVTLLNILSKVSVTSDIVALENNIAHVSNEVLVVNSRITQQNQDLSQISMQISTLTTDDIIENNCNLYFTVERARNVADLVATGTSNYIKTVAHNIMTYTIEGLDDLYEYINSKDHISINNIRLLQNELQQQNRDIIGLSNYAFQLQCNIEKLEQNIHLDIGKLDQNIHIDLGKLQEHLQQEDQNVCNYVGYISQRIDTASNSITEYINAVDTNWDNKVSSLRTTDIIEDHRALYFTNERVATLINASNIYTSNYVRIIANGLRVDMNAMYNNLYDRDNSILANIRIINNAVIQNDTNISNYVLSAKLAAKMDSNILNARMNNMFKDASNYIHRIDDKMDEGILGIHTTLNKNDTNISNYVDQRSEDLVEDIVQLYLHIDKVNNNTSNFVKNLRTDNIKEGTSNLYFTKERVAAVVNASNTVMTSNISQWQTKLLYRVNSDLNDLYGLIIDSDTHFKQKIVHLTTKDIPEDPTNMYFTYDRAAAISRDSSNYVKDTALVIDRRIQKIENFNNVLSTDIISEGSNMYFTSERVANIVNASNQNIYNDIYALDGRLSDDITNVSNMINNLDIAQILANNLDNTKIKNLSSDDVREGTSNLYLKPQNVATIVNASNLNMSNYVKKVTEKIYETMVENLDDLYEYTVGTVARTSNLISSRITTLNADQIADGINNHRYIVNDQYMRDLSLGNLTIFGNIIPSSNAFYNLGTPECRWNEGYFAGNSIHLANTVISADPSTKSLIIKDNEDIMQDVNNINGTLTKRLEELADAIERRINSLNTDLVKEGVHHKYIIDNVYDNNLVVTGKLTASMLEITDLEMTYEEDGKSINADLKSYINWVSSNIFFTVNGIYNGIVERTSNNIISRVLYLDNNMSNYLQLTSNELSNNLVNVEFKLSENIITNDINMSNYLQETSVMLQSDLQATSDILVQNILSLDEGLQTTNKALVENIDNVSNYVQDTNQRISDLNADQIADGSSNRFIIDGIYSQDLTVLGTLVTSNLSVIGAVTSIYTVTYQTENMEIISAAGDGPAMKIVQNGTENIAEFYNNDVNMMMIANNGLIGFGTSVPREKVDIIGNVRVSGAINNITNIELDYLSGVTSYVQEQIDAIISASASTSADFGIQFLNTNIVIANLTSNINASITDLNNSLNETSLYIAQVDVNMCNMLTDTSNSLAHSIHNLDTNINKQLVDIDNIIIDLDDSVNVRLMELDENINTQITEVNDSLNTRIDTLDAYMCNYLTDKLEETYGMIQSLNIDQLNANGSSNKFIINNVYDNDLSVIGTLTASNLQILGSSTLIYTDIYRTENLEIVSSAIDGPSLKIIQSGTGDSDIFNATYNDVQVISIKTSGDVDILGQMTATSFYGSGAALHSVNLSDRSTSMLPEGSNQYYTDDKVRAIVNSSNTMLSNRILDVVSTVDNIIDLIADSVSDLDLRVSITSNRTLDDIRQGESNKYIENNAYNNDLTVNGALTVRHTGTGNNVLTVYNTNNAAVFAMRNNGFFGNVANPAYNIDISGTINANNFRGSGSQLYNINLRDKTTSDLREGTNQYYTDEKVYKLLYGNDYSSGTIDNASFIANVETNLITIKQQLMNYIENITLDTVVQGSSNQYIVNNIYNDSLIVNGTLTVKDLRILDLEGDYYSSIYTSNLYRPSAGSINLFNQNTQTTVTDLSCNIPLIRSIVTEYIDTIQNNYNGVISVLDDLKENLYDVSLDNVIQGSNNKYIVNDLYNSSMIINGTLTVRDLRILELDEDYLTDIYNSNLYKSGSKGSTPFASYATNNISNIVQNITDNRFVVIENDVSSLQVNMQLLDDYVNITQGTINTLVDQFGTTSVTQNSEITSLRDDITATTDDIKDALYNISLDNVVQGSNNQYIVKNIYNDSLTINGTLTVRDLRILDIDDKHISDIYTSNLYNPSTSAFVSYASANVSNIVQGMTSSQANEISLLKNNISTLTSTLNSVLQRLSTLEALVP